MSDIRNLIRTLADTREEVYLKIARVDQVYTAERSCDVSPLDGSAAILDVSLQAVQSGDTGWMMFPRKDSCVVVGFFDRNTACVLLTEEVERLELAIGKFSLQMDESGLVADLNGQTLALESGGMKVDLKDGKLTLGNAGCTLKDILSDLVNALLKLTVTTSVGPSSTPVNAVEFTAVIQKLNALLG